MSLNSKKTEIKNLLDGLSSLFEQAEHRIRNLKIGQLRLSSLKNRKKKEWRKINRDSETCETSVIIWTPEGEGREKGADIIF